MYQNVTESDFVSAFQNIRPDNFSFDGLRALFEYLESYEEETGEKMELDVIALCCDFTEYKNLEEIQEDYNNIESMDDLQDRTQVIEFDSGVIIRNF